MSENESTEDLTSINTPRLMVAGASVDAGASTFVLGLLVTLKRAGVGISSARVGSSLVETTHHRRVTGRLSHTLDPCILTRDQMVECFARMSAGADMMLLVGEHPLYDLRGTASCFQTEAAVAVALQTPVILVVDAQQMRESIAAVVHGFQTLHHDLRIVGVVGNRVVDEAHDRVLRLAVEALAGPKYLGGLLFSNSEALHPEEATESNPSLLSRQRMIAAAELVERSIDLQLVRQLAAEAGPLAVASSVMQSESRSVRIAVADDQAFHLLIQDNLDLLRRAGAELVTFSPLADGRLPPQTAGVYFPSGYITLYASELSANQSMRTALRVFGRDAGVIYGEGAAVPYFCRSMQSEDGKTLPMVDLIPASMKEMSSRSDPVYVSLKAKIAAPIIDQDDYCSGIRFRQGVIRLEQSVPNVIESRNILNTNATESNEQVLSADGLMPTPFCLFSQTLTHWGSNPAMARYFVEACRRRAAGAR